jgi:hypothetical protein
MFNLLRTSSQYISIMMLIVDLKKTTDLLVSFLVLSKQIEGWLANVETVDCWVTHGAHNNCHCDNSVQDFVSHTKDKLTLFSIEVIMLGTLM